MRFHHAATPISYDIDQLLKMKSSYVSRQMCFIKTCLPAMAGNVLLAGLCKENSTAGKAEWVPGFAGLKV
jgi:hypothetical protein